MSMNEDRGTLGGSSPADHDDASATGTNSEPNGTAAEADKLNRAAEVYAKGALRLTLQ